MAKEYGIKSTEFVDIIQGFGLDIKSHLSTLDDAQVSDIRFKIELQEKKEAEETVIGGHELELTESDLDEVSFDEYSDSTEDKPTSSIGDPIGGDDAVVEVTETVSTEEIETEVATNIKAAGEARERYSETVQAIVDDKENWANTTQQVEIEKPT